MSNIKVAVINPPWPGGGIGARSNVRWPHKRKDKHLIFPLYLAYTSAVLKKNGFEVLGLDAVEKELGIFDFVKKMEKFKPGVVVMEVSTPSLNYDLETARKLKEQLPETFLVFCGSHVSFDHKNIMKNYSFVDGCVQAEFEATIRDLCIAMRDNTSLKEVKGLTWRNKTNGNVIINDKMPFIENLDGLPYPDRDDFRIEDYQMAFFCGKRTGVLLSSRGCPYQCSFCLWPETTSGHKYRQRSAKSVVDEIEYLLHEHNVDSLFFDDDTFALTKERMIEICSEIIKRKIKIPWICMGRVNTTDEDMIKIMKKAGCTQIFFGFESGSPIILRSIGKNITKNQMLKAVRITQKHGLVASGSFVFGLPPENKDTIKDTLDFAKKLKADFVQFTLAAPFPGTKFYNEAMQKGLLDINSFSDLDGTQGQILKTEHLSKEELSGVIRKAYLSYYTSPGVIIQNLKRCKNFNEVARVIRGAKSILARVVYYKK